MAGKSAVGEKYPCTLGFDNNREMVSVLDGIKIEDAESRLADKISHIVLEARVGNDIFSSHDVAVEGLKNEDLDAIICCGYKANKLPDELKVIKFYPYEIVGGVVHNALGKPTCQGCKYFEK